MSARENILARIRAAGIKVPETEIPSGYRRGWDAPSSEHIERLIHRLRDYGVTVTRVSAEGDIAGAAERRFADRTVTNVLIPADLPANWRPRGPALIEDSGQGPHELDDIKGVMTGCALAIAETGTIVLDAGAGQGRRAVTLVPDVYCCVVMVSQVVGIVPEAVTKLQQAVTQGRPITFISGPSATADIELDRVAGVHGPRTLEVVLVG